MSKWRPAEECLYVVPDIHGAYDLLEKILKRILPLRTTGGVKDKIVFLGDYIDRHRDTPKVLDRIIKLKAKYPEQVICLAGNHELMMLKALGKKECVAPNNAWRFWTTNGGFATVEGYIKRACLDCSVLAINRERAASLVPKEHFEFMLDLEPYHEHGKYTFVHGGYDPTKHPSEYDLETLVWDRSLVKIVETLVEKDLPFVWDNVIVAGHSTRKEPIITEKFMLLDCGSPRQLLCVELNSMEAYFSRPKKRLSKYILKEYVKKEKSSLIKRVE